VSGVEGSATPRAVPFYCPFCGEQDIRPAGAGGDRGTYHCLVCDRNWELTLIRVGPGASDPSFPSGSGEVGS
jgi:predicted RNA-binding Zn-ribbon protein involved in translation (DUF1610 family)